MTKSPWWVTSFVWQGRTVVMRFRLGRDLKPTRSELLTTANPEPSRALRHNAIAQFVARHRHLIEQSFAIAGDIQASRQLQSAHGYAERAA